MKPSDPSTFRVVVTDHAFPSLDAEREVLEPLGAVIDDAQCRDAAELAARVADADALLVQFAPIDAEVLEALTRCRVVVRYGIGVDNVDVAAATRLGVPISNVPDYALDEVADHAMTLLLAAARKLPRVAAAVRDGRWELSPARPMRSLAGSTLGLAGFGAIGRRVATRARAFGIRVLAYDPYAPDRAFAEAGVERAAWDELLAASDAISVHLPLTDETRALFDADAFAAMRPGALFVNTSRGGVVVTDALVEALDEGRVAFAGLDVLDVEPPGRDAAIVHHPNAVVTSHCAWYTEQALVRLQRHAAEEVARALRGDRLAYQLNRR
jgi:D-3-phosphoglycerate dehydrogenase